MSKVQTYIVEGVGEFPLDMLRYDQSWPATEQDSRRAQYEDNRRKISLETCNDNAPCAKRWHSFLWAIVVDRVVT